MTEPFYLDELLIEKISNEYDDGEKEGYVEELDSWVEKGCPSIFSS